MPMDRRHYPPDWERISREVRDRSGGRCECFGECGHSEGVQCLAWNGERHPVTGSLVVLTVAHLCNCRDRDGRKCGDPDHLRAMCQCCHLALDRPRHLARARITRRLKKRNLELFGD